MVETYNTENRNIHDHATRQIIYTHIAHLDKNQHNMVIQFQLGKVWNSIVTNRIPYNETIYILKREYKAFWLSWSD